MPRMTETWHADADKNTRPDKFVGKQYFHPKTGHLYRVIGHGIDAQREVWVLFYVQVSEEYDFTFVHTINDFCRVGRFLEVKE